VIFVINFSSLPLRIFIKVTFTLTSNNILNVL